jgi:hypothetical protein
VKLDTLERGRLTELEAVIERGIATFVDVGLALAEIRDGRLYRQTHSTFDDYCRERWGFSRSRGYRLIRAAELAAVSPVGDIPNERQARTILEPGKPDFGRRVLALAFGLDPDRPLLPSVEAVWQHAGERPPTLDEAIDAEPTLQEKLATCKRYLEELPELMWYDAGNWLLNKAIADTGATREFVGAVMAEAGRAAHERAVALEGEA